MLTLIDGNSILFRAYYGVHSRLTRSDGTPTGAVYGFFNMVLPLLAAAKPNDSFICVFDASRISFRQDIFSAYKANRQETPADLITQSYLVREGVAAMGIPVLCIPGVEADDVIATLARENCNSHDATRVITSDKDLMQLVSDCVFLYDGMKEREIRQPEVLEKFGVRPDQVIDVQSLMGDSSDNVPGVPGIGPKKASELINQFGSLDALYEHLDEVKNERIRTLLKDNKDSAYISKKLVTLKTDVDLTGLKITPFIFNTPEALKFVREKLESNSLSAKIEKLFPLEKFKIGPKPAPFEYAGSVCETPTSTYDNVTNQSAFKKNLTYETIKNVDELDKFLSGVTDILALDTETTGLNPLEAKIVGISLATDDTHGVYIPIRHQVKTNDLFAENTIAPDQIDIKTVHDKLWPIFTDKRILKIGHNLKYDLHVMANEGWNIDEIAPIDDTMLISYALHGTLHGHGLDVLAQKYLAHTNISFASLFPPKTKDADMHFDSLDIATATPYAAEDATICMALYKHMRPELNKNEKLRHLYEICDLPLMPILLTMERAGVLVNKTGLQQLSNVFHNQLTQLEAEIWQMVGHEFNIASPKQLGVILFDELHLPANKKRSTDADALNDLIDAHPVIEKILNWRSIAKLAGTYADALPRQIASDGRIHTTYNQALTVTGRLSSSNPNLQNIPIRTEEGNKIRSAFCAMDKENSLILSADYSQIELRLLAHVSGDEHLIHSFTTGEDIHTMTASKVFGVGLSEVTKEMRRRAKAVNFGIVYGQSKYGLAKNLGISNNEAQEFIDKYFETYPGVKEYMTGEIDFVNEHGYVETIFGRKRYLASELHSSNFQIREFAQRAAINQPLQGTAADLIKMAMIEVDKELEEKKLKTKMIMQVHDELIFEVPKDELETIKELVLKCMELNQPLKVPLEVDINYGSSWREG